VKKATHLKAGISNFMNQSLCYYQLGASRAVVLIAAVLYSDQKAANSRTLHVTNRQRHLYTRVCLRKWLGARNSVHITETSCIKCEFRVCLQRYLEIPFAPQIFSELQSITLLVHVLLYNVSKTTMYLCMCVKSFATIVIGTTAPLPSTSNAGTI
jgi:hypothetical protein